MNPIQVIENQNQVVAAHPIDRSLSAQEIKARRGIIKEVMAAVMVNEVHYGVIPGTDKPSLFKPGSEVLLSTFGISIDPEVVDLSTSDERRYRVIARGTSIASGVYLGSGLGECSSDEEKYKWRKSTCDQEFENTPEDRRRIKYGRGKGGSVYEIKQVRTNPADVSNTVLKMAKKRAQIDFTLTRLAASDMFTQDIEDMPEEVAESILEGPRGSQRASNIQPPKRKSESAQQTSKQGQFKEEPYWTSEYQGTSYLWAKVSDSFTHDFLKSLKFIQSKTPGKYFKTQYDESDIEALSIRLAEVA